MQLMLKERALRSNPRRHLERNLDTFPVFRPETLRIFGIPGGRHAGFNFGRVWIIRVVFVDDVLNQWQVLFDTKRRNRNHDGPDAPFIDATCNLAAVNGMVDRPSHIHIAKVFLLIVQN